MGDHVKVQQLDTQTQQHLISLYNDDLKFARFGEIGCIARMGYEADANKIRNMEVRQDDVWVVTFPRSGTTWTQELVWLIKNDLNFEAALKIPLMCRYLFLESRHGLLYNTLGQKREAMDPKLIEEISKIKPRFEIANAPSPRFIKTHMPLSLLPANLLETSKVVYVARDPRDVAVSFYHHNRLFSKYSGDFKSYWNLFINDLVMFSPFFPHVKEAWNLRHHPNMLFIFYEDMKRNLPSSIKRIARFYGKDIRETDIEKLCDHLDINNFRKNDSVNPAWIAKIGSADAEGFVRKGKSGGWRQHFDEEMTEEANIWMEENLANSDLRFPDVTSS